MNLCYVIDVFVLRFVRLCVIVMMSSSSFLLVFYFCLLFLIMEVVSPPFVLVVHPSNLSLDSVLVSLDYFYAELVVVIVLLSLGPRLIGKIHWLL